MSNMIRSIERQCYSKDGQPTEQRKMGLRAVAEDKARQKRLDELRKGLQ